MVTFPAVGRMGNFLFECSCALAYSLKHNLDFTVPITTPDHVWSKLYLQHLANPNLDNTLERIDLWENGHQYQELPFEESWRDKNIVIQGYRQSYKYIDDFRCEILYLFGFPYEKKEGIVSCHVRRGDYLHLRNKHPEVTKEWYEKAMSNFSGYKFKFFSDDISWCKENFGNRNDCEFSTSNNEVDDLVGMSCCEHNICSPSTFSWWGAWLNRNEDKKIYIYRDWFVTGWMNMIVSDIVPEEWVKL